MTFERALAEVKLGHRVARVGWNGKGMFIFLVPGSTFAVSRHPLIGIFPAGTQVEYRPHIDMKASDGSIFAWGPNNLDLLADDWVLTV